MNNDPITAEVMTLWRSQPSYTEARRRLSLLRAGEAYVYHREGEHRNGRAFLAAGDAAVEGRVRLHLRRVEGQLEYVAVGVAG